MKGGGEGERRNKQATTKEIYLFISFFISFLFYGLSYASSSPIMIIWVIGEGREEGEKRKTSSNNNGRINSFITTTKEIHTNDIKDDKTNSFKQSNTIL
jgi:hypothetical protein